MFCPKCGTKNKTDSQFCASCGFKLKESIAYAGFWRRFGAYIIDSIILIVFQVVIGVIIGIVVAVLEIDMSPGELQLKLLVPSYIISIVMSWLYHTLFESSSKQATPGKMAIGIIVTDLNGNRISFGKANGRYWGKIVSSIILFIGFIMAGFTEKKQALHDIMAETLVVVKEK